MTKVGFLSDWFSPQIDSKHPNVMNLSAYIFLYKRNLHYRNTIRSDRYICIGRLANHLESLCYHLGVPDEVSYSQRKIHLPEYLRYNCRYSNRCCSHELLRGFQHLPTHLQNGPFRNLFGSSTAPG